MEIEKIQSIDDLRNYGSIPFLVEKISSLIRPLKIDANTYEELFEIVVCLQKNWLPLVKGPFISKQAEIIYYLTKLEGKQRNNAIGMSDEIYENPEMAKKWYMRLRRVVHPDLGGDKAAFDVLTKLYKVAIDHKDDEDV